MFRVRHLPTKNQRDKNDHSSAFPVLLLSFISLINAMPPLEDSLLQSSIAKRIEAIKAMSKTADEFQIFISEFSTSLQDSAPYSFLDTNRLSNTPASARKELSGVRYQEYRNDLGIEALAGYTYNSAYLFEEPESMYRHSMYAGVRWRLLKGGLGESRSRARQAQTFIERDSIRCPR